MMGESWMNRILLGAHEMLDVQWNILNAYVEPFN